ncbi:MAG: DUF3429 domain-containing protein [Pseudomonadota bacterium]
MNDVPGVASRLGYAGLLPFMGAAALVWIMPNAGAAIRIGLAVYALAIVSFLAGAWWGIALLRRHSDLLIASNVVVIAAWGSVWLLHPPASLSVLAALMAVMVAIEGRHPAFAPQPPYYRRLRLTLTWVAVPALLLVALSA